MGRQGYDKTYYERCKEQKRRKRWQKKISTPKGYLLWQFQSIYNYSKTKGKTLPFSRSEFLAKFLADSTFLSLYKLYIEKGRLKYLEPKILRISVKKGYSLSNLRATSKSYDNPSVSKVGLESIPIKSDSVEFEKYSKSIISQITTKARAWLVPCASENELWEYMRDSGVWIGLFNQWVRSKCENHLQPKIARNKNKSGFVLDNLMLMADRDYKNRIERQRNWKRDKEHRDSSIPIADFLNDVLSKTHDQAAHSSPISSLNAWRPGPKYPF